MPDSTERAIALWAERNPEFIEAIKEENIFSTDKVIFISQIMFGTSIVGLAIGIHASNHAPEGTRFHSMGMDILLNSIALAYQAGSRTKANAHASMILRLLEKPEDRLAIEEEMRIQQDSMDDFDHSSFNLDFY